MSTIRTEKRNTPFVQIDKTALEDERLSWKAKGLLAYLLSRPDDWQVYVRQLSTVSADGKDATGTGLNELIDAGYVTRERQHDDDGRFDGYEYTVYETPELADGTVSGFSVNGLSGNGKTVDGKPATTNKDSTNTDGTNNDVSTHPPRASESPSVPDDPVEAHEQATGEPLTSQYFKDLIRTKVGSDPDDLALWYAECEEWAASGYNCRNIKNLVRKFEDSRDDHEQRRTRKGKSESPSEAFQRIYDIASKA